MSLETLYNEAPTNTYVGRARTRQSAEADTTAGVNFMDGTRRSVGNETSDEFQSEFTRNEAGSYVAGGAQPPAGLGTSADEPTSGLTRWKAPAFKLAFNGEGVGPSQLINGFYKTPAIFRKDSRGNDIHNYTPLTDSRFQDKNTSARDKVNAGPTSN